MLCVFKHHESVTDFTCASVFWLYTIPLIRWVFCVRVRVFCVRWQENLPPNCGRGHTTQHYSTSWLNYFPSAMKIDHGWRKKNARNSPAQWISKWLSFVIEFIKIDSVLMKMCGRMHSVRASFSRVTSSICFVCSFSSFFDFTLVVLLPFPSGAHEKSFPF